MQVKKSKKTIKKRREKMNSEHAFQLMSSQVNGLQTRLNAYERRFAGILILEEMLQILVLHYKSIHTNPSANSVSLTSRFYAYKQNASSASYDIPSELESVICSIWLRQISAKEIVLSGQRFLLRQHPKLVVDGKPLLLLIPQPGQQFGQQQEPYVVRERLEQRTHSHLIKNNPRLCGCNVDMKQARAWASNANVIGSTHVSVCPGHTILEELAALWLGHNPYNPPLATLTANTAAIHQFAISIVNNPNAGCHFTLSGQKQLHAYLVLTQSNGFQNDLARLAIGTVVL